MVLMLLLDSGANDAQRTRVRIVRCTVLLLDLSLAIRPQGNHSCGVTIPDRFIGVDDVDVPVNAGDLRFGQPESCHVCHGFQRNTPPTYLQCC